MRKSWMINIEELSYAGRRLLNFGPNPIQSSARIGFNLRVSDRKWVNDLVEDN